MPGQHPVQPFTRFVYRFIDAASEFSFDFRRSEIVQLKWQDIVDKYDENGTLHQIAIIVGKGKKERHVPIKPEVWEALGERKDVGKVFSYKHVSTPTNYFREIARECGVKARFHDLRHTAATRMINSGMGQAFVQLIMGHEDSKTTQRYTHVKSADLIREFKKLNYPRKRQHLQAMRCNVLYLYTPSAYS